MFTNFTRTLARTFVPLVNSPSALDLTKVSALALHSSSFSGNLTVRNTAFTANAYVSPAATGRRLDEEQWASEQETSVDEGDGGSLLLEVLAASPLLRQRRLQRRLAAAGISMDSLLEQQDDEMGMLAGTAEGSMFGLADRRQLQANTRYTMPLLESAKILHPAYRAGPWTDDLQAAVAVVCGRSGSAASCNLRFEGVTFSRNTGMATSGLAVMCDGADSCDVALTNCTVTGNKLLWAPATDASINPGSTNTRNRIVVYDDYSSSWLERTGSTLFRKMAPWLTYTYPLVDRYATDPSTDITNSLFGSRSGLPATTGRTLGAVVLLQRNSPSPGVAPSAAAMMRVTVTGGVFTGNDGSAIMSTAADFMDMAGGNNTWGGGAPRHSADVTMSGATFTNHTSGWPSVWMRWPRKVTVANCTVTNSTGAMWFDEVRDSAAIQSSNFTSNMPNQLWLDYWNFAQLSLPAERYTFGIHTGAGQWQTVKVQMTALGSVPNTVLVSDCVFDGNPTYLSGALYVRAYESMLIDKNDQPSLAAVTISGTNFSKTSCRKPGACTTFERPLYVYQVYTASLNRCWFLSNGNGGVYLSKTYGVSIAASTFTDNVLTFVADEQQDTDNVWGGAAIAVKEVGKGGVNITSSTFTNNVAKLGGGAIFSRQFAYLQVTGSTFDNNTAQQLEGGAIWMTSSDTLTADLAALFTISGCNFTRNVAGRNGGAINAFVVAPAREWTVRDSRFSDNMAMLDPLQRGEDSLDRCGGGAIFTYASGMVVWSSIFSRNKVLGHAGGAIRAADSSRVSVDSSTFEHNVAIMGGALALTRMATSNTMTNCTFNNNTVVDPWAWPETSPIKSLATRTFPSISLISAGFGGAISAQAAILEIAQLSVITNCSAKFGGAIAIVRSARFRILGDAKEEYGLSLLAVPDDLAAAANATGTGLPYKFLFAGNTALIGGALYVANVDEVIFLNFMRQLVKFPGQRNATIEAQGYVFSLYIPDARASVYQTPLSLRYENSPGILLYANAASGGGALYLEGNGKTDIKNTRFAGNSALPQPLAANYSGLYGLEAYNGTAVGQDCFGGGGGAVCVVGLVAKEVKIYNSDVLYNTAMDGGGMFISEGQNCAVQSGCYKVTLDAMEMLGNVALGRGGAIHWVHDNVLRITSCPRDAPRVFSTNGTVLFNSPVRFYNTSANETAPAVPYNITLTVPDRKGPAEWYGQLPAAHRTALLASIGGAVNTTAGSVYASGGRIQLAAGAVFALSAAANTTMLTEKGTLMAAGGTMLNGPVLGPFVNASSNGTSSSNSSTNSSTRVRLDAPMPLILNGTLVNDTDWLGIPYQNLPCGSWSNSADAGNDISTSAYVLMNPPRIDFYTSNTDIDLSVTVHDWFAQNCTGDSSTRAVIIVSAVSPDISGETSIPPVDGTAHFTAMRLRAREGLHNVTLAGRLSGPTRELLSDMVSIYVRPCGINEFLAPKNLDECIPCDSGNYNFNVSAVSCGACPDNADCRYPDSRCVANDGEDCDVVGFMVPEDGYWHSSFFSEQVIECPNPDSCTTDNRSDVLATMQQRIFHLARSIQLNTSTAVADEAAKWVDESLVYNNLRRLLQVKAISDTNYTTVLINITKDLLPDYLQKQCAEGYTGTLCGECAVGYGWSQVATCVQCSSKALNDLYYALVTLLTLSLLAFTVYSSLKEQKRQGLLVGGKGGKGRKSGDNASPVHSAPMSPADTQYQQQVAAAADADAAAAATSAAAAIPSAGQTAAASTVPQDAGDSFHGVAMILDPAAPDDARQPQQQVSSLQAPAQLPPLQLPTQPLQSTSQLPPLQTPANMPLVSPDISQYEDPVVSAARGHFPSAPGTPRNPAAHAPYPTFDAPPNFEARSGASVTGAPQDVPLAASAALLNGSSPMGCPPGATNGGVGSSLNAGNGNGGARPVAEGIEEVSDFEDTPKHTGELEVRSGSVHAAPPPLALPHEPHHLPPGIIMQAVPMMHGTPPHSPSLVLPHSPRYHDLTHGPSSPGYTERPSQGRTQSGDRPSNQSYMAARRRAHQSTVVKIFVSYIQVLALLQNVPLDIPGVMDTYYRINNQATSYPGILVSLDCSIPDGGSVSKAFIRVILAVLAPLYIFAGAVIFFLLFAMFDYYVLTPYLAKKVNKRGKRKHALQLPTLSMHINEYLPRQLIVTFITIMFFFYPNVVQSIMTIFSCVDVDTYTGNELATGLGLQTDPVWSQDFGQVCYEGAHLGLALGLGVPAVILIAVGWPLVSALLVAGKMGCLTNIRFTEDMTEMFLADFKAKYVWWESVVMLRKFAIAMIVTFVDDGASAGVQLLLVICVLVIAVALHLVSMPYHHIYTNNLELVSLVVLLATLYFSLYFSLSASLTQGGRIAISVIILVINILMVLTFVYYIIQAYWYAALYNSGIAEIDKESREKLTADEIKKRIMARQMIDPSPSPKPGGAPGSPPDVKSRSSLKLGVQHRMASLYASAVVAGLRVGSTTNKVLHRMKTMLDPQPPSRLASLDLDPEAAADSSGHAHSAPAEARGAKSTRGPAPRGAGSAPAGPGAFEMLPQGEPGEPTAPGLNSADLTAMQASLAARRRGPGSTAAGSGASTPMTQGSPTPSELMGARGGATHSSVTHGRSRLAVASSSTTVPALPPVPGSQPTIAAGEAL